MPRGVRGDAFRMPVQKDSVDAPEMAPVVEIIKESGNIAVIRIRRASGSFPRPRKIEGRLYLFEGELSL